MVLAGAWRRGRGRAMAAVAWVAVCSLEGVAHSGPAPLLRVEEGDAWQLRVAVERGWLPPTTHGAVEGGARWSWRGPDVLWQAGISAWATTTWEAGASPGPGLLGIRGILTATAWDVSSSTASQVSGTWEWREGPAGQAWEVEQGLGWTRSWIVDPVLLTLGAALAGTSSFGEGGAVQARAVAWAHWRYLVSERLGVSAGVTFTRGLFGGAFDVEFQTGVTLLPASRREADLEVSWSLEDPGRYALRLGGRVPR